MLKLTTKINVKIIAVVIELSGFVSRDFKKAIIKTNPVCWRVFCKHSHSVEDKSIAESFKVVA